jgi:hypothetical protein
MCLNTVADFASASACMYDDSSEDDEKRDVLTVMFAQLMVTALNLPD